MVFCMSYNNLYIYSLIEFAEAYLMLTHYPGASTNGVTFHDRLNYILDQDNPTPGKKNSFLFFSDLLLFFYIFIGFITREHSERVFNRLNRYNQWGFLILVFLSSTMFLIFCSSWLNLKDTTSADSFKPATTNWESHWSNLDDGSGW